MRILQVISYFYPAWSYGGPGKLVYEISRQLSKKHDVTVYSTDAYDQTRRRTSDDDKDISSKSLKTYFFKNISNLLAYRYKIFTPFESFTTIYKEIDKFDVIHIHEFFTFLTIFVTFMARAKKIPYLISAHGTLSSFHYTHRKSFKNIFMKLFGKKIINNASMMIAATKEEVKEYESYDVPNNKIKCVPNGLDISEFNNLPPKNLFKKRYGIDKDTKILVYLGRINKLKGLNVLVDAFAKVSASINNCYLVIAGSDDGYLSTLQNQVMDLNLLAKVFFPGVTSGKNKLEMYADADIFVYPSPAEGFSIAILEAAASGLPVVISEGCKFPEVNSNQAGFVVPYKVESFYDALIKLLDNEDLKIKYGINARNLVQNKFSIEVMVEKLEQVYQKLICFKDTAKQ